MTFLIEKEVTVEVLSHAFKEIYKTFPLLSLELEKDTGARFHFKPSDTPFPRDGVVRKYGTTATSLRDLERINSETMNSFSERITPHFRAVLITIDVEATRDCAVLQGRFVQALLFAGPHSLLDGHSLVTLARHVNRFLVDGTTPELSQPQRAPFSCATYARSAPAGPPVAPEEPADLLGVDLSRPVPLERRTPHHVTMCAPPGAFRRRPGHTFTEHMLAAHAMSYGALLLVTLAPRRTVRCPMVSIYLVERQFAAVFPEFPEPSALLGNKWADAAVVMEMTAETTGASVLAYTEATRRTCCGEDVVRRSATIHLLGQGPGEPDLHKRGKGAHLSNVGPVSFPAGPIRGVFAQNIDAMCQGQINIVPIGQDDGKMFVTVAGLSPTYSRTFLRAYYHLWAAVSARLAGGPLTLADVAKLDEAVACAATLRERGK
eukprot:gnl/Chilomastix_cuspidata/3263.p1 GENE.gnl/Chilomastix_cuspidata/3263~~gnl/Chilomastix_cuspidata/3263.p1  ORF type:complete len:483 (-),score=73.52 gnl/Chilomastix_cuspidata/3263:816-2114(-)